MKGVYPTKTGKFKAGIVVNKQYIHLGYFDYPELAEAAVRKAEKELGPTRKNPKGGRPRSGNN